MATILKLPVFAAVSVVAFLLCLELVEGRAAVDTSPYFPAIFALGDSLLDIGNNNKLNSSRRANFLPYGIDFSPKRGAFSNGKGFMDYFAKFSRLTPIRKHADLTAKNFKLFNRGVNFASSGSGVLSTTNCIGDISCISFPTQVKQFVNVAKKYSKKTLAKSAIVIAVGSNDYFQYISTRPTIPIENYMTELVTGISDAIQQLYGAGARKIVLFEIGALGCTPSTLAVTNANTSNPLCNSVLNGVVATHNFYVKTAVSSLTAAYKDLSIINVKQLDFVPKIQANPASYGFKNATSACCGGGPFNGIIRCGSQGSTYCKNRNDFLFWDFVHITQKAWALVTEAVFNGDPAIVSPYGAKCLATCNK